MNLNSVNNVSFKAEISPRFLVPARRCLEEAPYRQQANFDDSVRMFKNMPNTDGITISYEKTREDGELKHVLLAQKGDKKVILSKKDQFRKLVEKFSNINEHEFKTKWTQQKSISDTVSFKGKSAAVSTIKKAPVNEYCATLGNDIYKTIKDNRLDVQKAQAILNIESPVEIALLPISQNPAPVGKETVAHMLPMYYQDLTLAGANIYCKFDADKRKKFALLCADMAHEYNHVLQRAQDESYFGIKKHSSNTQETTAIIRTAQVAMNEILRTIALNTNTHKDFRKTLASKNDVTFEQFKALAVEDIDIAKEIDKIVSFYAAKIPTKMNAQELKSVMKNAILISAQQEVEAYTTTIATLEKIGAYEQEFKNRRLVTMYANQMLVDALDG